MAIWGGDGYGINPASETSIIVDNAIECPSAPGVKIKYVHVNSFSAVDSNVSVGIGSTINGTGAGAGTGPWMGDQQGWTNTLPKYEGFEDGEGTFYDRDDAETPNEVADVAPPASDLDEILEELPVGGSSQDSSKRVNVPIQS